MAEQYDNTNQGALFKNTDKTDDHPSWADYQGSQNVECPHCGKQSDHWLSAWIKTAKKGQMKGQTFMSTALKPKQQREAPPASPSDDGGRPF